MVWQDVAISVASLVFALSLVPQVRHGFRRKTGPIKLQTSVPTFSGLYVISFAYLTLGLYYSAMTSFATGTLWLLLFVQGVVYGKKGNRAGS